MYHKLYKISKLYVNINNRRHLLKERFLALSQEGTFRLEIRGSLGPSIQAWATTPKHQRDVPMNRPSDRLNFQEGDNLRRPQAGYRVPDSVASAVKINKCI